MGDGDLNSLHGTYNSLDDKRFVDEGGGGNVPSSPSNLGGRLCSAPWELGVGGLAAAGVEQILRL